MYTNLDWILRQLMVDTIMVTGVSTEGCCFFTAADGFQIGYRVIFVDDCCGSSKPERHETAVKHLKRFKVEIVNKEEATRLITDEHNLFK